VFALTFAAEAVPDVELEVDAEVKPEVEDVPPDRM